MLGTERLEKTSRARWPRAIARLFLYGGAVFVAIPVLFAHLMTATDRSPISAPSSGYEELTIHGGEFSLRAWLSRVRPLSSAGEDAPDFSTVILVHGLGDTLESYQTHAAAFIERGHRALLLDLRAHGGSDGTLTTLGGKESEDVLVAIDALKERGLAKNGVILVGHSMGAVAVILAAARSGDVRAVVAEAPFDSYRDTVRHHAKLLYGLPSWVPLPALAIWIAEWHADFDADAIDCVAAAANLRAPLMAIVDGEDRRMPESVVRRIVDAHPGPSELWVAEGVGHVGAILNPGWEPTVFRFLVEHGLSSHSP